MTQACLRRASVVIPGTEKCDFNGEEEDEGGECSGSIGQPEHQLTDAGHSGENSKMQKIQEKIQEGLERTISAETKDKIEKILNDANQLSDVEKLLLYLKLPTGSALAYSKDGSAQMLQSSNRLEQIQAVTWIKSHLEEHSETSLPKQEVFDDYKMYCEGHGYKFLSQGDFGKVMKCVFPNVKPRRLGQRGQSKHCYGGLRKKLQVGLPTLPDVSIDPVPEVKEESEGVADEVLQSSCELVLEWAHKLLNQQFSNIKSLAEYLVTSNYVNGRSMAAFTVLAAIQNNEGPKTPVSSGSQGQSSSKHRETQLQLQRKLQERELLREQKRKLEMQYTDNDMERHAIEITPDWTMQSQVTPKLENSTPKQQTSATVQKLLLPKTSKANSQAVTTTSPGNSGSSSTVAHPQLPVKTLPSNAASLQATSNGSGNQSILVFSPPAHLGQSGSVIPQQLLILSPISAGGASNTTPVTAIRPQSIASLPQAVAVTKAAAVPTLVPMQQVVVNTIAGQPQTAMAVNTISLAGSSASSTLLSRSMTTTSQVTLANNVATLQQTPTLVASSSQILTTARTLEVDANSQRVQSNANGLGTSAFIPVSGQINQVLKNDENLLGNGELNGDCMLGLSDDSQGLANELEDLQSPSSPLSSSSLLSPNSAAFSSNQNSDSNRSVCGGSRQKLQPRTVSSMLKEQRGSNIVIDNKSAYVNDNRPVSALLKESRQRQALAGTGSVLTNALSPNTLMIQAVTVNNASSAISNSNSTLGNQSESSNGVMVNAQPLLATALLQVNDATCSSDNSQSSCSPPGLLPVSSPGFNSFNLSQSVKFERARHSSGPEHKSELAAFLEVNGLGSNKKGQKRELQTPDLPKQKRNLANNGRNRSHHGSDNRNNPKDNPILSVAASFPNSSQVSLAKHLLRTDSFDKDMSYKDTLLECLTGEPAPDLNDITPSIDQMVNSQEEESLGQAELQQNKQSRLLSLSATASSLGVPAAAMMAVSKQVPISNQSSLMSILSGRLGLDKSVTFSSNQQSLNPSEQDLQQIQQAFPSQLRGDVLLSQVSKPFPDPSSRVRHRSAGAAVVTSQLVNNVLKSSSHVGNSPSIRKLLSSTNDNSTQQQQQQQQQHGNKNSNGTLPLSSALSRMARRAQSVGSASVALQQQQQVMGGSMPASPMMSPVSNAGSATSANSTPVPSPGSVNPNPKQDADQAVAAFVPIQTSQQGINAKFTLVRPSFTATLSSHTPVITNIQQTSLQDRVIPLGNTNNSYDLGSQSLATTVTTTKVQGPKLQNVAGNMNVASASATGKKLISSNPIIRERLARKLKDTGSSTSAQSNDHFVAASTIKPVKRGQKMSQKSSIASKRQRHHSAQSALGSNNSAVSSPASVVANFMHLNQQELMQLNQQGLRQLLNSSQDSQPSPVLSSTDQTNGRTSLGPSTPESPFSPEMQDIFVNSLSTQPIMVGSSFRSQSVPVSDTFYTGSDNQDLFQNNTSMMIQQRDNPADYLANGSNSDLASLLQERFSDDSESIAKANDVFLARRNLTELLDTSDTINSQPGGAMLCSSSRRSQQGPTDYDSFISKGDMMLPSLSLPDNSLMDVIDGHQHVAPTPPTSKNPTPDFSHELSSLQTTSNGMTGMQGSSKLDTPSSLDTLSTHSRESLNDHQLFSMYDGNTDMTTDVSPSDMDMISSDYFQSWDMPQMVHD